MAGADAGPGGLPNVAVKLSGMVTEADWASWTPADLDRLSVGRRLVRVERLMFGSDWPVCLLAASYAGVLTSLEEALGDQSHADTARIFGLNAERMYRLRR